MVVKPTMSLKNTVTSRTWPTRVASWRSSWLAIKRSVSSSNQPAHPQVAARPQLAGQPDLVAEPEPAGQRLLGLGPRRTAIEPGQHPDPAGRALGPPATGMGQRQPGPQRRIEQALAVLRVELDPIGQRNDFCHRTQARRSKPSLW
jgi:hypothetical protein